MNITNKDYETIKNIYTLLPTGTAYDRLPAEDKKKIEDFDMTLKSLLSKKEKDNKRIAAYIADKRKDNKNYARTPYIKKGDR